MIQPEFGYSFQIGNILVDEIYNIFIRRVYINQRRCLRLGKVVLQLIKMETLKNSFLSSCSSTNKSTPAGVLATNIKICPLCM